RPDHFTGLVGKHDFQLVVGQNKLIVNQPLDIKLTISGVGALENLEAPKVLNHQGLEEFEINGDLKITDANQATKIFDYTYLAKENLQLPPRDFILSYFDQETQTYVTETMNFPELVVAGGVAQKPKKAVMPENPTS